MRTQDILHAAGELALQLDEEEIKRDYPEQLFRYLLAQRTKKSEAEVKQNLKTLLERMPRSGFEKRGGDYRRRFNQTKAILETFRVNPLLLELSLDDLIQVLGWTVRLMGSEEIMSFRTRSFSRTRRR